MKRWVQGIGAVAGLVLLLCQSAAAENMIRFSSDPTLVGLIHWWAEEHGIFEKNGLKYTDTPVNAAYIGLQGIGAGSNDVASMTEPPIVTNIAKGIDAIIVANLARSHEVFKMVAPMSVNSIEELKGKKVTWMGGTGAEYALIRLLEAHGMTVNDFEFVNLPPAEEVPTAVNGGADAMWSWEPWPRKLQSLEPGKYHVIGASSVATYEANMIMTIGREFAEKNPEAVKLYLKSLIESTEQIKANKEEAIQLYMKHLRTSEEEARASFDDYDIGVWLDDKVVDTLNNVSTYLIDNNRIEKAPDWKALVDPSFLRDVAPDRVADLTK
jgi:ABC-type nitrate/sulfonate/bicarbonate transport system substrate-binding protein